MTRSRLALLVTLLAAGCASVARAPSTAPDTARLDEAAKAHASEMDAHLDAIEAAVPLVGGEGIAAPLAAARAEESDYERKHAEKIAAIESKAEASVKENEALRARIADLEAEKYGFFIWLVIGGLVAAAGGVGLCFTPMAKLFGVGVIAAGLALAGFALAFEMAIPWLKIAVPVVIFGAAAAVVWQVWANRHTIFQLVRVQEIAKTGMDATARAAVFANGKIADTLQSKSTKRLVASIRDTLTVKPLTEEQLANAKP